MTEAAATKEHTGAMIALMLDESDSAALLSALPPDVIPVDDGDGLHLTLLYLGDTRALGDLQDVIGAALEVFTMERGALTGLVSGVGRFTNDEGDGTNAVYASFDAADLPALREDLVEMLARLGIGSPSQHGFTPHITLAYVPAGAPTPPVDPPALKLTFRAITLMWGGARMDYSLLGGGFTVTKAADGRLRWVLVSSNAFEDRDREIVSQKALADDVERADADGDYGPLLWWHLAGLADENGQPTPRVELGVCDFNAMHGRMLVESGTFHDERIGRGLKEHTAELGTSIGFFHPESEPDSAGIFHHIRRYERSLLPLTAASNPLTALSLVAKEQGDMLPKKVNALKKLMGADEALVDQFLAFTETKEAAAMAANMRHKEVITEGAADQTGPVVTAKATITVTSDDKPGDKKPDDEKKPDAEKPAAESAAAPAKDEAPPAPADGAPPVADPSGPPVPPVVDDTIGKYTEQQLAEYVSKVIDAVFEKRDAAGGAQQVQAAAAKEARDAEMLTAIKQTDDKLTHILKEVADAKAGAATALLGVAELQGETPRSQNGYRASRVGKEISADEAKHITKEFAGPSADPMSKHWAGFIEPANPVPGQ